MVETKIFSRICTDCGKEIQSLHRKQFEYNWKQHEDSHNRKEATKKMINTTIIILGGLFTGFLMGFGVRGLVEQQKQEATKK